ncbi:hypothetical protein RHECNPAF_6420061 [Rhizobium etli CNPAF512]|nr:hypothetical protein RHECNPAF_6420061 [Rhizobium etli CNPAF512]
MRLLLVVDVEDRDAEPSRVQPKVKA